jgi:alkylated DNA repair dioxygenase AlkB
MNALPGGECLVDEDGCAVLWPNFYAEDEAQSLFGLLMEALDWKSHHCKVFTYTGPLPRQTAWYGPVPYEYSNVQHPQAKWPSELEAVRIRITDALPGTRFNSVLANLYRDGSDSVSWHADNEEPLGDRPLLASLSLGEPRRFLLRRAKGKEPGVDRFLAPGSLLVMAGTLQKHWVHSVPKTKRRLGPRLNLTLRTMAVTPH